MVFMCWNLARDATAGLVRTQALERRVTDPPVRSPLAKRDLAHEHRLDAVGAFLPFQVGEWGLRSLQPRKLRRQLVERSRREAGTDLADVAQLVTFVDAEQQTAKTCALSLGLGEAADHELLALHTLDLAPVAG